MTATRRTLLKGAAMAGASLWLPNGGIERTVRSVGGLKRLLVFVPHPDDEVLSMWPSMHYLASGYETHFVYLTRGEVTPGSVKLDGAAACPWHGYTHNPAQEGYTVPTLTEIGLARYHEGQSAAGAMAMISPTVTGDAGQVFTHDEDLGTAYGCGGCASSTAPWTEAGVAAADEVIRRYIGLYPNSLIWSMTPSDAHPDHAACGVALRRLKGTPWLSPGDPGYLAGDPILKGALGNARFWVSKQWWNTPAGQVGSRMGEQCGWWPNLYPNNLADSAYNFTRRAEYTAWLRNRVVPAYQAWNPAEGSFAVGGGHSTPSQFANCFGLQLTTVSALWHG